MRIASGSVNADVGRMSRPALSDMVVVGGLLIGPVALSLIVPADGPYRGADWFGFVCALVSVLALLWRQVTPLGVLASASVIVVVNAAAGNPVTVVQWPVWIALFTCFVWRPWRSRLLALGIVAVGVAGYVLFNRGPVGAVELSSIAVCILLAAVTGDATRSRRLSAAAVAARLDSERQARAALADQAVQQERIRWARELHDAVGHAVNVMVMQAGVGRRVFADNPAFSREALSHVESVGRDALAELDRLLRNMGDDRSADAPTMADIGVLAARVRATGRELELNVAEVRLRASASRALYRIVQEAVTNALRHTTSGRISIAVTEVADTVVAEIFNEGGYGRAADPGRGLINMRERARLECGEFEAGPTAQGFRVRAAIPIGEPGRSRSVLVAAP